MDPKMSFQDPGKGPGPKNRARALFWALAPPGAPKEGGEASRAFLRGVAFTYVSFSPIRGLATPFRPDSQFLWNLHALLTICCWQS